MGDVTMSDANQDWLEFYEWYYSGWEEQQRKDELFFKQKESEENENKTKIKSSIAERYRTE